MRNLRMFFALLTLCLGVLWGGVEPVLAQSNPIRPSTWGGIKAGYGISDKADAQHVGGVNRYDAFPAGWKFPFRGSYYISVGYNGCICNKDCSRTYDQYHRGNEQYAIDWSLSGESDFGQDVPAPASGWATAYFGNTGYGTTSAWKLATATAIVSDKSS